MRLALAIGVAYFVAAWLGLALIARLENVAIFWPASGIATGALVALGHRAWQPVAIAVATASVAANVLAGRSLGAAFLFALCNIGEALLAAGLIRRWFGPSLELTNLRHVVGLLLGAAVGSAVSGLGAAIVIRAVGESAAPLHSIWHVWFAAHALGIASVAPLLTELPSVSDKELPRPDLIEGLMALTALFTIIGLLFAVPSGHWATILPDALVFPLLVWAAIRCRMVFTAAAISFVALTAVAMMSYNVGRLGDPNVALFNRVIALQIGLLATTLLALALAAVFSEQRQRRRSEARLWSILEATNVVAW
jgi:integral membrane sensor domain MASE1